MPAEVRRVDDASLEARAARLLEGRIRDVPDFPVPGVLFRDITPLLLDPPAYAGVIELLAEAAAPLRPEVLVAVEARGFLLAAPLALKLQCGLALARKPGKLPAAVERVEYRLEYGDAALEMHRDLPIAGRRAVIVDDLLATGGTSAAAARLVRRLEGEVAGFAYLLELPELGGKARLAGEQVVVLRPLYDGGGNG